MDAIVANGLIDDIESLTRDRGYDPVVRACLARYGLTELEIQKRGTKPSSGTTPPRINLGLRWIVAAANSWWSNRGRCRHG